MDAGTKHPAQEAAEHLADWYRAAAHRMPSDFPKIMQDIGELHAKLQEANPDVGYYAFASCLLRGEWAVIPITGTRGDPAWLLEAARQMQRCFMISSARFAIAAEQAAEAADWPDGDSS